MLVTVDDVLMHTDIADIADIVDTGQYCKLLSSRTIHSM